MIRVISLLAVFGLLISFGMVYLFDSLPADGVYANGDIVQTQRDGDNKQYYYMHTETEDTPGKWRVTFNTRWYEQIAPTAKILPFKVVYDENALKYIPDGVLYRIYCDDDVVAEGLNNPYESGKEHITRETIHIDHCDNYSVAVYANGNTAYDSVYLYAPRMSVHGIIYVAAIFFAAILIVLLILGRLYGKKFRNLMLATQIGSNYHRMWPFIKPYWFRALIGVLLTIPVGSLDAVIAMALKPIMDNVMVAKEAKFSAMLPFLIVGFTLLQGILTYSATYVNSWVGTKISLGVKRKLFDVLLRMDTSYYDGQNSGMVLFRYNSDAELATSGLINNLKLFLTKFFSSVALVAVMLYNSWQLTIMAIGVLVFAVYPVKVVRRKIKDVMTKTVGASSSVLTIYNEAFNGNKIIKSFTLEKEFKKKHEATLDFIFTLTIKLTQGSGWLSPLMHFIGSIGVALVVGYGSFLIVSGTITPGNFVSFIGALLMLYTPLKSIGNNYVDMQKSFISIERVYELIDIVPSINSSDGSIDLKKIRTGIEFRNVTFGYTAERKVLDNISFKINVGQTVALVGNSGGGKTTISSLIPRLYEINAGEILIDNVSIKDYTLNSLRRNIAMVFQDNFLFSGTLRDNLLLGNLDANEIDMWKALKNANLDMFVKSLENQLDTEIGERGMLLSGGQKQRVAIARAFIKNAPVVILDEATSALDNKAEKVVQDALDNLMKDRTVIVIAHRLSTVQNADNIIVINEGKIVEQGTHRELLDKHGAYYGLYFTQFVVEDKS